MRRQIGVDEDQEMDELARTAESAPIVGIYSPGVLLDSTVVESGLLNGVFATTGER